MHYMGGSQRRKGVEGDLQEQYVIDELGLFEGLDEKKNDDYVKLKTAKDVEMFVIQVEKVDLKHQIWMKIPGHESMKDQPMNGSKSLQKLTCKQDRIR